MMYDRNLANKINFYLSWVLIYIYMCVCVCVRYRKKVFVKNSILKHTKMSFLFISPWLSIELLWSINKLKQRLWCTIYDLDDSIGFGNFCVRGYLPLIYYSYAWSCSLCERRTSFCSRKLCGLLLMFSTGFASLSFLFLFSSINHLLRHSVRFLILFHLT